jgi:hypothetical protein
MKSKVLTKLFRTNDVRLVQASISIGYENPFHSSTVEFRAGSRRVNILSVDKGSIADNVIHLDASRKFINSTIDHVDNIETIDCLISYLNEHNELIDSENVELPVDKRGSIRPSLVQMVTVETDINNFRERDKQFRRNLKGKKPLNWRVRLDIQDDVVVEILSSGDKAIYVAFGEINEDVLASDVIFQLVPGVTTFVIPREVIWMKYGQYAVDAKLGISGLVKADFHLVKNIFYKSSISNNSLSLSDLPRKTESTIDYFTNPLGGKFESSTWIISKQSSLPVIR